MVSALPPEQIRRVLQTIRELKTGRAPKLDSLSEETSGYIANGFSGRRTHEQGEAAARWVRDKYHLRPSERFEIYEALEALGVELDPRRVEPPSLRALAVWGKRHGPAVLLNIENEFDIRGRGSVRVTLARELCHLLLDHGRALSAIEISSSKMPLDIERRAKAFAGELLLPREAAAEAWSRAGAPTSLEGLRLVVERLQESHGVTASVSAWKLDHALQGQEIDLSVRLDSIAPNR